MRSKLIMVILLWLTTYIHAQTWQTTHLNGASYHSTGACRLDYNKIKITIHRFYMEVEEEAQISAIGRVWTGDSLTLEITGQFRLPQGSALRSMLLWNGNKLLKAKLRDRDAADSAYEEVVDRDKQVYVPRDPALIEYMGDGKYRYKIYPVSINNSRKIRICYTIPLSGAGNFELLTAFTISYSEYPKSISVEFVKSQDAFEPYFISYNSELKPIHFGSTYLIPYIEFANQNYYPYQKKIIKADNVKWNHAFINKVDTGATSGFYTAIYSSFPDSLAQLIKEMAVYQYTCEAGIGLGGKNIITPLPVSNVFNIYIKSIERWNGIITWYIYDEDGTEIIKYDHQLTIDSLSPDCAALPLLWGAKYSLSERKGNMGSLYGFVDERMSLLALESDFLDSATAAQYSDSGIPPLLPHEIIVDPSKIPVTPKENIIVDYTNIRMKAGLHHEFLISLLAQNMIVIESVQNLDSDIMVQLYDLKGRLIYSWKNLSLKGRTIQLKLPQNLRGAYIIKLRNGSYKQQHKLLIK